MNMGLNIVATGVGVPIQMVNDITGDVQSPVSIHIVP